MKITQEELKVLKEAKSEKEWEAACDFVKNLHCGFYPDDWYEVVILGEIATFKKDIGNIEITVFPDKESLLKALGTPDNNEDEIYTP